jgi:RNA polymerase sigma factor (sigma-70 family)
VGKENSEGDGSGMKDLWEQNIPLAHSVAGRFTNLFPPQYRDEIYAEARVALWEACKGYDSEKGTKFSTYATPIIKNKLRNIKKWFYRQKRHPTGGVTSLQREVFEDISILDTVPYHQDFDGYIVVKEILRIADEVDPALRWRYVEGLPPQEIADRLGVTKKYVSGRLRRSRKKLKERLEGERLVDF